MNAAKFLASLFAMVLLAIMIGASAAVGVATYRTLIAWLT